MRSRELAELLLRKAKQDEHAVETLAANPASAEEIIGFHAQQAVEKMLKAVLGLGAVRYGSTHNLGVLLDLLRDNNIPFPQEFEEVRTLTPFASTLRYEDMPPALGHPFERPWALDIVRRVRAWAEATVRGS